LTGHILESHLGEGIAKGIFSGVNRMCKQNIKIFILKTFQKLKVDKN
jgi:hypothetical protein